MQEWKKEDGNLNENGRDQPIYAFLSWEHFILSTTRTEPGENEAAAKVFGCKPLDFHRALL